MANTTFKGPVRSQNGFLEWDGSAWVPVGGGGGGGSALIAVPNGTLNLVFTEIGQIITVVNDRSVSSEGSGYIIDASCPLAAGQPIIDGRYISGVGPTFPTLAYGGDFPIFVQPNGFMLQFVLAGIRDYGYGSGLQPLINFTGYVYDTITPAP
jgi:hypothetical protein